MDHLRGHRKRWISKSCTTKDLYTEEWIVLLMLVLSKNEFAELLSFNALQGLKKMFCNVTGFEHFLDVRHLKSALVKIGWKFDIMKWSLPLTRTLKWVDAISGKTSGNLDTRQCMDISLARRRESSPRVQDREFDIIVRNDMSHILGIADDINGINSDLGVPLMATLPWLMSWANYFSTWEPLMIEVRSVLTKQLMAYAMLAKSQESDGLSIVAMGNGSSKHWSLPARDADSACALAKGIADTLSKLHDTWSLDLGQVRDSDPVIRQLAIELKHAQLLPELPIPHVLFSTAQSVDELLSKKMRKQIRRARNHIEEEGLGMEIRFDRGLAISTTLIDEVEAVHVSRDRDNLGRSDLDAPTERDFWRRLCEGGYEGEWEVEIAQVRLNSELAAYVVALLDGDTYRVYDGRMSSKWQDYSPGRLIESAALDRAIRDPRFQSLDWMSGVAAETLLTTNSAEGRGRLVASSQSARHPPSAPASPAMSLLCAMSSSS
eukprot:TRINITY_DN25022_c0_g1_i1.p1 TRINITY_DN25022_c0_g1~~TRINITY_DN25022_c0_g1_i1.p1  ORF type:complete len:575 (-),score=83.95 TRINITY_DN25022_c0_g1_i1:687-2159(-)